MHLKSIHIITATSRAFPAENNNRVDQAMCPCGFQHNECCRLIARVIRLYSWG